MKVEGGQFLDCAPHPKPLTKHTFLCYIFSLVTTTENDLPTGTYAYARMSSTVNKDANINRRKTGRLLTRNIREGFLLIIQLLAISNEKLTKLMSESKGCVQHNPLMLEAGGGRPNVRSLTISLRHLSHSGRKLDSQNDLEQWRYQGGI